MFDLTGRKPEEQEFTTRALEKAKKVAFNDDGRLSPLEECALIEFVSCALSRGEISADLFRHALTQRLNRLRRMLVSKRAQRVPCPCIKCQEKRYFARRRGRKVRTEN